MRTCIFVSLLFALVALSACTAPFITQPTPAVTPLPLAPTLTTASTLTTLPTLTAAPTQTVPPTITPGSTEDPFFAPFTKLNNLPASIPLQPVDLFLLKCPTAAEVAAIDHDIKLIWSADPTKGKLACTKASGSADLTLLQRRIYRILGVMKQLQFSKPLPWTNKSLWDWFVTTIKAVNFRSDVTFSGCCSPKDTIVIRTVSNSYDLQTDRWDTGGQPDASGGLRDTIALFAHEARHNEHYVHDCPNIDRGTVVAPNGNDKTIAQMGAWAVQYYFYKWLAEYTDVNFFGKTYQDHAEFEAGVTRTTRFCNEPK